MGIRFAIANFLASDYFSEYRDEINKLKREVERGNDVRQRLTDERDTLQKKLNGDRVCDFYCGICEHHYGSINSYTDITGRTYISHGAGGCLLDCKCADFKRIIEQDIEQDE